MGRLRVVSAEALIGFKLQALVNDPSRGVICPIFVRCCVRKPLVSIWLKSVSTLRCSSARSCWMSCLPKSPTVAPEQRAEGLLGRDVASLSISAESDLSDWTDLMEAIEALCPVWPEHQTRKPGIYKL